MLRTIAAFAFSVGLAFTTPNQSPAQDKPPRPNIVIIFCDDLGYGDLGCYGHPTIRTPELDQMAGEGMRFTQFYSAAPVCTPSRAALLTGRLPIRTGLCSSNRRVLFPDSQGGLQAGEITIAEILKQAGYATTCIGKWHLGHLPQYLPTRHGFDSYFGIPYSNDMLPRPPQGNRPVWPPLPLMRGDVVAEPNPDQSLLTERYTDEAIQFIKSCTSPEEKRPFFVYLPHTMPHVPLFASERFAGKSPRGLYGDVIETIDFCTGRILKTLRDQGVAENTLVLFTSDNGPWLTQDIRGGSAGLLRDGKGSTWEGGMREPFIAWWPGKIPAGSVSQALGSTLDFLPTACRLAGVPLPTDRELDGFDLTPVLLGKGEGTRDVMFYYRDVELFAIRKGPWKAHFKTQIGYQQPQPEVHNPPLLFHLEHDPSERFDVAKQHPQVVAELVKLADEHRTRVKPGTPQID